MSSTSTNPSTALTAAGQGRAPRSIAELGKAAQGFPYDGSKSLKEILITTSALKKAGDRHRDEGDLEAAFISYARAATIVLERIPSHVSYQELTSVHRHNLNLNGNDILDPNRSAETTPRQPPRQPPPQSTQSSGASASSAAERARTERAEAVRRQAEENAAAVRRHAEETAKRDEQRRIADAAAAQRRRDEEEQETARWNLQQLESSLQQAQASTSRQYQHQQAIPYQPPPDDDFYLPQPHSLQRPRSREDDSSSEAAGPSLAQRGISQPHNTQVARPGPRGLVDPITTTSPSPPEDSIQYPNLMSPHQRTQGYAPSLQSMFTSPPGGGGMPPPSNGLGDTMLGLDVTGRVPQYPAYPQRQPYQPPAPQPPAAGPSFGYGGATQPFVIRKEATEYPHAHAHAPSRPPKPFDVYSSGHHGRSDSAGSHTYPQPHSHSNPAPQPNRAKSPPPVIKASELPADELPSRELKPVVFPRDVLSKFVQIASYNTSKNLETCGLLLGRLKRSGMYIVTTLTCSMEGEEILAEYQVERDLLTLGWIHTHPTQSCFMSSVDLHTHAAFQHMLPEAFAVVCAPKSRPNFGIFRLTDPPGLQTIMACTDADKGHVLMQDLPLEIADLRDRQY
ncbi:Mov34-domain-containing protein [Auriculariales sp. MPI-PUGE-AT-0066]|nr:Mov34-domain-containing protein [Auriculariales sp. MPI-PUGE-AT-0066]